MSMINDAFENVEPLYLPDPTPVTSGVEEPLYIDISSRSVVEEAPVHKRTNDMRLTSKSLHDAIERAKYEINLQFEDALKMIPFMAQITSSISYGDNKWYYSWAELLSGVDGVLSIAANGRTGDKNSSVTRATNVMEYDNTDVYVNPGTCVDTVNCDYPEGFSFRPITGKVIMFRVKPSESSITTSYRFQAENQDDGTCE